MEFVSGERPEAFTHTPVDAIACKDRDGCGKELAADDKAYRSLNAELV
jgi:hypothetical protein